MKKLMTSASLFLGLVAIVGLTYLGSKDHDVALHIATIAIAIAGARSWEGSRTNK